MLACDADIAGSSPLTRGAQGYVRESREETGLIPAHAGSTGRPARLAGWWRAHPRSHGEHLAGRSLCRPVRGLIPAHAGSTTSTRLKRSRPRAHPRSRGEHFLVSRSSSQSLGSSPLTRGALQRSGRAWRPCGLIPAHAGSTPPAAVGQVGMLGSSPLTRGARLLLHRGDRLRGLIPAHAGSTLASPMRCITWMAHPRSRGEHPSTASTMSMIRGSSPLTRGAPQGFLQKVDDGGLIPAHAGSTAGVELCKHCGQAHPRSRGEHHNQCSW